MSHWILLGAFVALTLFAYQGLRRGKMPPYIESWAIVFWIACVGAAILEIIIILTRYV